MVIEWRNTLDTYVQSNLNRPFFVRCTLKLRDSLSR